VISLATIPERVLLGALPTGLAVWASALPAALVEDPPASDPLDLTRMVQDALAAISPSLDHPGVVAGALVVLSILLAKIIDKIATSLLRVASRHTETLLDDEIIDGLHGPIVKSVVLGGIWLACHVLEGEDGGLLWAHRAIVTLAVLVWLLAGLRLANLVLAAMGRNSHRFNVVEDRTLPLFDNLSKLALVAFAGYMLIKVWQLDATGWLASAGVAGIALGFAAKDTLANLFSGVFIIADAPYRLGDYVNLDSGHRGRVVHIGLRSTRILTRDDVEITVPNSVIGGGAIINETSGAPRFRIRTKIGVAYGSDLDLVRKVLMEVGLGADHVMKVPEPRVRFRSFGDSALMLELMVWIPQPELRGRVLDALNTGIYERFGAEGIVIPFPQRDVHLHGTASVSEGD
jgi:small-conductance mechanosensitive channel